MAKGARASTKKANHQKLKSRVFGPVESARTERLSAKFLELASQPKPQPVKEDIVMKSEDGTAKNNEVPTQSKQTEEMEVDQEATKSSDRPKTSSKGRIEKTRHHRKASIVFPKYSKGKRVGGSRVKK
ncbi:uncharacterized protein K444DRAFT_622822 [Hyaloscypha bicolor E]|uniref:DUF2423 domain-containing protein n=1 Tax=Hyaloscypha bicolor E TaxID=1095630 RepID=A0A2J6SEQ7_9HELO|nr:uncharacterized protein K444DRAFT_622822 [Hyaloscypha bicolor E]PMD49248.1 hypothetical protein K444DRAFT_622822 [Hyaloscypha bicolor E]